MTWNHRVIKHEKDGEVWYTLHEVFYDDDGSIKGWTQDAIAPLSETRDGLYWVLDKMREAVAKPVLKEDGEKAIEIVE